MKTFSYTSGGAKRPSRRGRTGRGAVAAPVLDDIDKRIIARLQDHGRESFSHIADELGVATGTIRNRYARLARENVLEVVAITNPLGLGFTSSALVGAVVSGGRVESIAEAIAEWGEVAYLVITSGRFDLLIEIIVRDEGTLYECIRKIRDVSGIERIETFVYMSLVKQTFNWNVLDNLGGERSEGAAREIENHD